MRRTDLDAATLATHLRGITGDGSFDWCYTPMQASVLLDIADMLDDNAKLHTAIDAILQCSGITKRDKGCDACPMYDKAKEYVWAGDWCGIRRFLRELGIEVGE